MVSIVPSTRQVMPLMILRACDSRGLVVIFGLNFGKGFAYEMSQWTFRRILFSLHLKKANWQYLPNQQHYFLSKKPVRYCAKAGFEILCNNA
jgi:hypothetical protein